MKTSYGWLAVVLVAGSCLAQEAAPVKRVLLLHAARMLDVASGSIVTPGEVLVEEDRILAAGSHV